MTHKHYSPPPIPQERIAAAHALLQQLGIVPLALRDGLLHYQTARGEALTTVCDALLSARRPTPDGAERTWQALCLALGVQL